MNIIEAAQLFNLDKDIKLKRRSKEVEVILHPLGEHLMKDDSYSIYLNTIDDILAEDWYVVKDEKLHTFEEAIVALKNGKSIKRHNLSFKYSIGSSSNPSFKIHDVLANDWIIIDKEETK